MRAEATIAWAIGQAPRLYRPPYGVLTARGPRLRAPPRLAAAAVDALGPRLARTGDAGQHRVGGHGRPQRRRGGPPARRRPLLGARLLAAHRGGAPAHGRGDRPRRPGRGVAMTGAHPLVVASLTGQLTSWIGHHGAYAVFAIMALDALLPVGGELTMLFAGALAAGAIAGEQPVLLGHQLQTGLESYLVLAARRHAGLPAGLARRLGHRPLGRARAARAPRALAARDAREPRARRALVRSPRARRGLPRAPHAASCAPSSRSRPARSRARSAPTRCSRWPARRSGASASPPSGGRWASSYERCTTRSATSTCWRWPAWWRRSPRCSSFTGGGACA